MLALINQISFNLSIFFSLKWYFKFTRTHRDGNNSKFPDWMAAWSSVHEYAFPCVSVVLAQATAKRYNVRLYNTYLDYLHASLVFWTAVTDIMTRLNVPQVQYLYDRRRAL